MKKILSLMLLLLLFLPIAIQAQYGRKPQYAPRSEKHRNIIDELDRKQGIWKFYSRFGDLLYETEYANDKRHGVMKRYYASNAKLMEEISYYFGKKDGEYRKYYYSGQIQTEGQYENGRRVGIWKKNYSTTENIKSEGEYIKGKKEGVWKLYNSKGNLLKEVIYKNGLPLTPDKPKVEPAGAKKVKPKTTDASGGYIKPGQLPGKPIGGSKPPAKDKP